jgi:crotonobetainyl-CoA:carnitine CoA-transferase CaiB-like acyl-CoA transferase
MDSTRVAHVAELGGLSLDGAVEVVGADPVLATPWPVGEVAAVALAHAGVAAARLSRRAGAHPGAVRVAVADAAAATIGFAVMRVDGESMARTNVDNPWVGRYRCADGRWIHLHGGFPVLAERLASLLDLPADADETAIGDAVGRWGSGLLEDAIAARHGCSAIIRTEDEWRRHPQGELVRSWPTVVQRRRDASASTRWAPSPTRPLEGLRVLDLTRVLAGPSRTRSRSRSSSR